MLHRINNTYNKVFKNFISTDICYATINDKYDIWKIYLKQRSKQVQLITFQLFEMRKLTTLYLAENVQTINKKKHHLKIVIPHFHSLNFSFFMQAKVFRNSFRAIWKHLSAFPQRHYHYVTQQSHTLTVT